MAGKKRQAGNIALQAAVRHSTQSDQTAQTNQSPCLSIIEHLLDIAISPSRSDQVLQAFCDQRCWVVSDQLLSEFTSSRGRALSSSPSRTNKAVTDACPHLDCYWIVLATNVMNHLLTMKRKQKKDYKKDHDVNTYLAALTSVLTSVLLSDKAKLEKAAQSQSASGSSRSILCSAFITSTVASLHVLRTYDSNGGFPSLQEVNRPNHWLEVAVQALYRMVHLASPSQSDTGDFSVGLLNASVSWTSRDVCGACESVDSFLGPIIKDERACVEKLLSAYETSVYKTIKVDASDSTSSAPPPSKRSSRSRRGTNKPQSASKETPFNTFSFSSEVISVVEAFEKLLKRSNFLARVEGRVAAKRWSSIAVVWSRDGNGQLELLQLTHHLAKNPIINKFMSNSKKSRLFHLLICIASEVGMQCGVRSAIGGLDRYLGSISSLNCRKRSTRDRKQSKSIRRCDVRDWSTLVIYDFLQNHKKCLWQFSQSFPSIDVVNDGVEKLDSDVYLAPGIAKAIRNLCNSSSASVSIAGLSEHSSSNKASFTIAAAHVLDLLTDASLPLDCELATFAVEQIAKSCCRMDNDLSDADKMSKDQYISNQDSAFDPSNLDFQNRFERQYNLLCSLPTPSAVDIRLEGSDRCVFAGVLSETGIFPASSFADHHAICVFIRALRGNDEKTPFGTILPFLIDLLRRVYDTRMREKSDIEKSDNITIPCSASSKKRKSSLRIGAFNRKGDKRRKLDQGSVSVHGEVFGWQPISPERAKLAIEAVGALRDCFDSTKLTPFSLRQMIRRSITIQDLKGVLHLGTLLEMSMLMPEIRWTGGLEFPGRRVKDFSSHEEQLWLAHMSMCQVLGDSHTLSEPESGLDPLFWTAEKRDEMYKVIASTCTYCANGSEEWPLCLPAAHHAFLATNMSMSLSEESTKPERAVAGGYIRSLVAALNDLVNWPVEYSRNTLQCLAYGTPLSYSDAQTLVLAMYALESNERRLHLESLVQAATNLVHASSNDDMKRQSIFQQIQLSRFLARVLVVCSSLIRTLLPDNEQEKKFKMKMRAFPPSLQIIEDGLEWHRRDAMFLDVYGNMETSSYPPRIIEEGASCLPGTLLDDLRQLFESATSLGYETTSHDHGYLLFAAWNGLDQVPQSLANVLERVPSLNPLEPDASKKLLQIRDDVRNLCFITRKGHRRDGDTLTICSARLKMILKHMIIQAHETVARLESEFFGQNDGLEKDVHIAAVVLMAALPSYISAIVSCMTVPCGNSFLTQQSKTPDAPARWDRGYSSESEPQPSDVDSESDNDNIGLGARARAFTRVQQLCSSLGAAPIHPDWLDTSCILREGMRYSDLVEVADLAIGALTRLACAAHQQHKKHQMLAFSGALHSKNVTVLDQRVRVGLALMRILGNESSTKDTQCRDLHGVIAAIARCPRVTVNNLSACNVDPRVQPAMEMWCLFAGQRLPGLFQEGNQLVPEGDKLTNRWDCTPAELRAAGEWELLLVDAISLACLVSLDGQPEKRNKDDPDKSNRRHGIRSDVVNAKVWRFLTDTAVNHLVPAGALLRMGLRQGGRKSHPLIGLKNVGSLDQVPPQSLEASTSISPVPDALKCKVYETLALLAALSTESGNLASAVSRAVANHFLADTSSFSLLEGMWSTKCAFDGLRYILEIVEVSNKKDLSKDDIAFAIQRLIFLIGGNGNVDARRNSDRWAEPFIAHKALNCFFGVTVPNKLVTVVGEATINDVFKPGTHLELFDEEWKQGSSPNDRKIGAVGDLVKVLCEGSLRSNGDTRGLCALFLNRVGTLEAQMFYGSSPTKLGLVIVPAIIDAFNRVERKCLMGLVHKDLFGVRGNVSHQYTRELASLLSLLLISIPGSSQFLNAEFVHDLMMASIDSWKMSCEGNKTPVISFLVSYGTRFDSLFQIGSKLLESSEASLKSRLIGKEEMLSTFFSSLLHLKSSLNDLKGPDGSCDRNGEKAKKSRGKCDGPSIIETLGIGNSCSFIRKSGFHAQHWYHCHTCGLTNDRGCCSLCALVCHRDHDVSYSRHSSFFCDCSAEDGGSSQLNRVSCKCLSPLSTEKLQQIHEQEMSLITTEGAEAHLKDNLEKHDCLNTNIVAICSFGDVAAASLHHFMERANSSHWLNTMFNVSDGALQSWKKETEEPMALVRWCETLKPIDCIRRRISHKILMGRLRSRDRKTLELEYLQHVSMKPIYTATGFRPKFSSDSAAHTVAMARLSRNDISRDVLTTDSRGRMVIAEPKSLVFLCPLPTGVRHVMGTDDRIISRKGMSILASTPLPFNVVGMRFSCNEGLLAVWGTSNIVVLVLKPTFDGVEDMIHLSFDLDDEDHLLSCEWLPESQTNVAVSCSNCVRIYDICKADPHRASGCSEKRTLPVVGYTFGPEDKLRDVSVVSQKDSKSDDETDVTSKMYLLFESGRLYYLDLSTQNMEAESRRSFGLEATECVSIPTTGMTPPQLVTHAQQSFTRSLGKGAKLCFLRQSRLLLYQCKSTAVVALLIDNNGCVEGSFELLPHTISTDILGDTSINGPYTHWTELAPVFRERGAFFRLACVGRSTSSGQSKLVCLEFNEESVRVREVETSNTKSSALGFSTFEGLAAFSSPIIESGINGDKNFWGGERVFLGMMASNGALMCYGDEVVDITPLDSDDANSYPMKFIQLSTPASSFEASWFPLTLFERLQNVSETNDLLIVAEGLGLSGKELKDRLSRESSLSLTCPREGCCILFAIKNNRSTPGGRRSTISAIRILLGSPAETLPARLAVQGRSIDVAASGKRWYNIPLTCEEVACAIRTGYVSLWIASARDLTLRPIVESIEVFSSAVKSFVVPKQYCFTKSSSRLSGASQLDAALEFPLANALNATTNLVTLTTPCSKVSDTARRIFWKLVEETTVLPMGNIRSSLQKLASLVEPNDQERERHYDDHVLKACFASLRLCSYLISQAGEGNNHGDEKSFDPIWRSIYVIVQNCVLLCMSIAKHRPINFLQSTGSVLDGKRASRSIAVEASKMIATGRNQFDEFVNLTPSIVELILTEMALDLLSDESSKHSAHFPNLHTIKEHFDSLDSFVVGQCCRAASIFFKEHSSAHCDKNPDMFVQLEAARLVAYQCDGCLICPMKDVRYTFPDEDEGIDLCHDCYMKGMRYASESTDRSLEVVINDQTVGMGTKVTCADLGRLQPVSIEKLEIASTTGIQTAPQSRIERYDGLKDGPGRNLNNPSRHRPIDVYEIFLERVFDFVLGQATTALKGDCNTLITTPYLGLLLDMIRNSKSESRQTELVKKFVCTMSHAAEKLLDTVPQNQRMSRRDVQKLLIVIKASTGLGLGLQPNEFRNKSCALHGIPVVRRRCASGPNKDRRFNVCGMEKGLRCEYFVWADEGDHGGARIAKTQVIAILANSFWTHTTPSGLLCDRLCGVLESEVLEQECGGQEKTCTSAVSHDVSQERDLIFFRRLQAMKNDSIDYQDGVYCSREKLHDCVFRGLESTSDAFEITFNGHDVHHDRYALLETILRFVTLVADYKTIGISRWFSLLCSVAMSSNSNSLLRTHATKALKSLCDDKLELYKSVRDFHSFQFYLKRIFSHSSPILSAAMDVKERSRQCGTEWREKASDLSQLDVAGLVGVNCLMAEDAGSEMDLRMVSKALEDLLTTVKRRACNWRQFCGVPSFPISIRDCTLLKTCNPNQKQVLAALENAPPIVSLFWIMAITSGSNQVKLLRLIDVALGDHYHQNDNRASYFPIEEHMMWGVTGVNRIPDDILASSQWRLKSDAVVALVQDMIYGGDSVDLRRTGLCVVSKLLRFFNVEEKCDMFWTLLPLIDNVGTLGRASSEYMSLMQLMSSALTRHERIGILGDALMNAFRLQSETIKYGRSNGDWELVELNSESSSTKTKVLDLSPCYFCCNTQYLAKDSSKKMAIDASHDGIREETAETRATISGSEPIAAATGFRCKQWHQDQVSPFLRQRLDTQKTSDEFNLYFSLKSRVAVLEIHMSISEPRGRHARVVNVYVAPRPVQDVVILKTEKYAKVWQKCGSINLARGATAALASLSFPVVAANIRVEFAEFYERPGEGKKGADGSVVILCPRCIYPVSNSHGVCGQCGDAIFQCRKCRHINYDRLDGFFCAECGYCPMGTFSFEFVAGQATNAVAIINNEDCEKAEKMLEIATTLREDLRQALRKRILRLQRSYGTQRSNSISLFDSAMHHAFLGLPPIVSSSAEGNKFSLQVERLRNQGSAVKAIGDVDLNITKSVTASGDRSERQRSLLSLARQIRNDSDLPYADRRLTVRGLNLDSLEEILQNGIRADSPAAQGKDFGQPDGGNSKGQNRESRKGEIEVCKRLYMMMREAEKEGWELRRRLDCWTALNAGCLVKKISTSSNGQLMEFLFSPSHCSYCSKSVALDLLTLWESLLLLSPSQVKVNERVLNTLFREDRGLQGTLLTASKRRVVVSIATTSESGAGIVLEAMRKRLSSAEDLFCAEVLGKILESENSPLVSEFKSFALEILGSQTSTSI